MGSFSFVSLNVVLLCFKVIIQSCSYYNPGVILSQLTDGRSTHDNPRVNQNGSTCESCCKYMDDVFEEGEALHHGQVSLHCVEGDLVMQTL